MCFPVDRVRVTVSVREHRFAFLLTSLDFQKRNCEVKVVTVFKIATLRAKSLSRKVTPLARPQAPVSRSLCVHTAGCYRFSKIPANRMGERQVTVVRFSSSVAHHVKRSVSVFPYANAQLYSLPTRRFGFSRVRPPRVRRPPALRSRCRGARSRSAQDRNPRECAFGAVAPSSLVSRSTVSVVCSSTDLRQVGKCWLCVQRGFMF